MTSTWNLNHRSTKYLLFSYFIYFRKAFDCIPRQKLVDKLRKEGVHRRFLNVLISTYPNDKSGVKIDDKLTQSFTSKGKVPCCHPLFLISIARTTHVTMDTCFPGREKHIKMDMCCAGRGTHITRNTSITMDMCFPGWKKTYHEGYVFSRYGNTYH